jgi:hypothetical protein
VVLEEEDAVEAQGLVLGGVVEPANEDVKVEPKIEADAELLKSELVKKANLQ